MRVGAIIAEYNPFHNGHKLQLDDFSKKSCCDFVVAIMSGSFAERGDAAIFDKWARTRLALQNGIDMVLELPVYHSLSNAQGFAYGAVSTIFAANIFCALGFGAETDDLNSLTALAELDIFSDPKIQAQIKKELALGVSYPRAVESAIKSTYGDTLCGLLSFPNTVLAAEYLRAIKKYGELEVYITKRDSVMHDSVATTQSIASASAIRTMLTQKQDVSHFAAYMPRDAKMPDERRLSDLVLYALRRMSPQEIAKIADVSEGLENTIYKNACECESYGELLGNVKSKRYTMARIKRICMCALLGINKSHTYSLPRYVHVLGIRERARAVLLPQLMERCKVPVIMSGKDINALDAESRILFDREVFATDLHALVSGDAMRKDYTQKLIIL